LGENGGSIWWRVSWVGFRGKWRRERKRGRGWGCVLLVFVVREFMLKGFASWGFVFWGFVFWEFVFREFMFWAVVFLGSYVRFLGS
jgi:hypothetical protein